MLIELAAFQEERNLDMKLELMHRDANSYIYFLILSKKKCHNLDEYYHVN